MCLGPGGGAAALCGDFPHPPAFFPGPCPLMPHPPAARPRSHTHTPRRRPCRPPALQLKHDISALACKGDLTFAAVRGTVVECRRMHRSGEYRGHSGDITHLLVLGDKLLSLGRDGRLLVWTIGDYDAPEVR